MSSEPSNARRESIGFIGLGIMGRPMAGHLIRSGYSLTILETGKSAMHELVAAGAATAKSPKELAQRTDVVITMLPAAPELEDVVLGANGVLMGLRPGSLLIDMSTMLPAVTRSIAEKVSAKGSEALDAPVSGGQVGAEQATLAIMVGGSDVAFERARQILEKMGKNVTHVGAAGAGQIAKAANQIIVGVTIAAVSEALVLAAKAGVDPAKVREALMGGFASSRVLDVHGKRMIEHSFAPGARMALHRKDMDIILRTAREYAVSLPLSATIAELMDAAIARGANELDHSSLVTVFEELANHRLR